MINTSEWNPIVTPSGNEYALVRLAEGILQIKLYKGYVVNIDAKAIPQLINILTHLEKEI